MHSAFQIGGQSADGGQGPRWLAAGQARLPEPPAIADRPGAAGAKAGSYSVIRVLLCGSWFTFRVCLSSIDPRAGNERKFGTWEEAAAGGGRSTRHSRWIGIKDVDARRWL